MGAGLLAKVECQSLSMLAVRPLSRASPLPQVQRSPFYPRCSGLTGSPDLTSSCARTFSNISS
ncbi:hypothetical protein C5612_24725 [Pseudomonas frederiksbergensis]|uniref:Uncharacterized protein n=1 Tax=Pseudomonas frederiksbergensis TaxID=104087 RepID=A0A2S8HCC8_9PSED|nr:hypothetical protein C5612_24725 [Pseudomonas frederiksbergensis]